MRRNKFKKELSKSNEIKANKSSIAVKIHLLKELNKIRNARIYCSVLNKSYINSQFLIDDKNKLYNYVAGNLAKQIKIKGQLEVRIDKSKGKQLLRDEFDTYFKNKLELNCELQKIDLFHSYSHSWAGLQFADMLAWSYFQNFEHKNDTYVNLIKIESKVYKIGNEK